MAVSLRSLDALFGTTRFDEASLQSDRCRTDRLASATYGLQWPPLHVMPPVQTVPQAPQFALSLLRSLQTRPVPAQSGRFGRHVHALAVHVAPAWHTVPHALQFFGSLLVSVQVPGVHSMIGGAPHVHVPVVQILPPVQAMPHMPQSELFVSRLTHAPTQLVSVASQVAAHRPFVHT